LHAIALQDKNKKNKKTKNKKNRNKSKNFMQRLVRGQQLATT
jgi:hypothetical protein